MTAPVTAEEIARLRALIEENSPRAAHDLACAMSDVLDALEAAQRRIEALTAERDRLSERGSW